MAKWVGRVGFGSGQSSHGSKRDIFKWVNWVVSQSGRVKKLCHVLPCILVSEILHVSQVAHPDYPAYQRLRTVSKDELLSHFCETPSIWGERQNTLYSGFAKSPRFLNMVITFVLTPLSHYNSITEPRA